jgi:dTDP-4-amino-4,6-dideoxy-D-galactose acyltransferase
MSDEPCELLEWETRIFGVAVSRVRGDTLTPERAAEIDRWCTAKMVGVLFFAARSDDPQTIRCAEEGGYRLVEVRMTFEKRPLDPQLSSDVRTFIPADLPALQRMARSSYTDSRFYCDPRFSREQCDQRYVEWTTTACVQAPQRVFVAVSDDQPIGYVTCEIDGAPGWGRIGLIAVDEASRGRGTGRKLVEAALAWAARQNLAGMSVVTQGRNVVAQRLYQRSGFVTRSLGLYYHKWYV